MSRTDTQMFSVILLDCLTKLNGKGLTREAYQIQLDVMLMERTGRTIELDDIESLIKD